MIRWICTLALVVVPGLSEAQSLFGTGGANRSESMFQDRRAQRAQRIGDILTVLIMESTSASNTAIVDTEKDVTLNWISPGGLKFQVSVFPVRRTINSKVRARRVDSRRSRLESA